MIEVVSFSKKYPHAKDFAVENVNMKIADGIITGLIGPNGSGKTTLIKAICGFHFATKGSIKVFSDSDKKVPVLNEVENFSMQEDLNIEKIGYVDDLKKIYTSLDEEKGYEQLQEVKNKWDFANHPNLWSKAAPNMSNEYYNKLMSDPRFKLVVRDVRDAMDLKKAIENATTKKEKLIAKTKLGLRGTGGDAIPAIERRRPWP